MTQLSGAATQSQGSRPLSSAVVVDSSSSGLKQGTGKKRAEAQQEGQRAPLCYLYVFLGLQRGSPTLASLSQWPCPKGSRDGDMDAAALPPPLVNTHSAPGGIIWVFACWNERVCKRYIYTHSLKCFPSDSGPHLQQHKNSPFSTVTHF